MIKFFKTTFVAIAMIATASSSTAQVAPVLTTSPFIWNTNYFSECSVEVCINYSWTCDPGPCSFNNASYIACTVLLPQSSNPLDPAVITDLKYFTDAGLNDCGCTLQITGVSITKHGTGPGGAGTETLTMDPGNFSKFKMILEGTWVGGTNVNFSDGFLTDCDGVPLGTPKTVSIYYLQGNPVSIYSSL